MKTFALALLIVSTLSSFGHAAGFAGTWEGAGDIVTPTGSTPCSLITVTLVQTPVTLSIVSGKMICGPMEADVAETTMVIQDSSLVYENKIVGNISDTHFVMSYSEGEYTGGLSGALVGDTQMQFGQSMVNPAYTMSVTGLLTRK